MYLVSNALSKMVEYSGDRFREGDAWVGVNLLTGSMNLASSLLLSLYPYIHVVSSSLGPSNSCVSR